MKHTFRNTIIVCTMMLSGCQKNTAEPVGSAVSLHPMVQFNNTLQQNIQDDWSINTYEIIPYSYNDSDGDGIGDLNGITEKIADINTFGFQAIWLTPIQQADSYHKYDVTDYMTIDPQFGTKSDFETMIETLHQHKMKYIMDLVINHTSSNHPWFKEAVNYLKQYNQLNTTECKYLDYYHFQDSFAQGFTQIPETDWYYESRFTDTMPDLNLDSEMVKEEIKNIVTFWLEEGVDGFRLDAVTSYDTGNLSHNIEILSWLNQTIKKIKPDAYIVGEAWTNQSEYQQYYQSGIDSLFDFAYAGNEGIISSVMKGVYTGSQFIHALTLEEQRYKENNPDAINAPFYTNHDMARNAGYYIGEDALAKTKMAIALNFLQTGNAYLYYGEEIGMKGSGKDENKRAPMQWDDTSTLSGPPGMDNIEQKYPPLSKQQQDPDSIYTYVHQILKIRNAFPSIARSATEEMDTDNSQIGMMKRGETIIVINPTNQIQTITTQNSYQLQVVLLTTHDMIEVNQSQITMPPFSIGVLQ